MKKNCQKININTIINNTIKTIFHHHFVHLGWWYTHLSSTFSLPFILCFLFKAGLINYQCINIVIKKLLFTLYKIIHIPWF